MPRGSKIAPAMARQWLEEYDSGATQDRLASKHHRTKRTVAINIERARQQLAFERALQERLSDALGAHQQDLLELVQTLKDTVHVPDLELWPGRIDFGLEDLLSESEWLTEDRVSLKDLPWDQAPDERSLLLVSRDKTGPQEIGLLLEESKLWVDLRQHLGGRDPIWRDLSSWKDALLSELRARAAFCRAIVASAEREFNAAVKVASPPGEKHLSNGFPHLVRAAATRMAISSPSPAIVDRLGWSGNELVDDRKGRRLGWLEGDQEEIKRQVAAFVGRMALLGQARHAARTHMELTTLTAKVRGILEDYQLLHYIRGRCTVCKKLGGI